MPYILIQGKPDLWPDAPYLRAIPAMAGTICLLYGARPCCCCYANARRRISQPQLLAIDRPIARNINLSYRFKRAQLRAAADQ